jgi:uncharacterized membrane protein
MDGSVAKFWQDYLHESGSKVQEHKLYPNPDVWNSEPPSLCLMPFTKLIICYLLTFVVFFVIDMAWLGFIAKDFYRKHLGEFLSDQVNWSAAFIFYLLFIAGVFIFAILPAVEKDSVRTAMILGGLFGFFTYGVTQNSRQ